MAIALATIELPNLTRKPLSAEELAALPKEGIQLVRDDACTGERKPPDGIIRQYRLDWFWHPNLKHADEAAQARGERCFLTGAGVCVELFREADNG